LVEQGFAAHSESIEPAFEVSQVTTAVGLVEAGLAVSILPSYALASARSVGVVQVPLVDPVVDRNIVALTAPQRKLTQASAAFLGHFTIRMGELAKTKSMV
jgi:LysR family carnitine catabolism transcriptional activator